jgi:hypothetical protein
MRSKIKIVLRDPLNFSNQIDYNIIPEDNILAEDWIVALKQLLTSGNLIEKNFCFLGFPKTARNLEYLCSTLNHYIDVINDSSLDYRIEEVFTPSNVIGTDLTVGPDHINHDLMNKLHQHFEVLQGTVNNFGDHYLQADVKAKYAIRQLNIICHEIENLVLSQRKARVLPFWVRPSQITTFLNATRHDLKDEHRRGFVTNGYDRVLGGVYMHWAQIGKTLYEVFRDEGAPELTETVCSAITHLQYYSGEFDIEWGNDVTYPGKQPWHAQEQQEFRKWLSRNGLSHTDPKLSLGYLPIGQVDLQNSFGTTNYQSIWDTLSNHLDIYKIEVDNVSATFNYCWTDADYEQQQIDRLRPGYNYHTRNQL